MQEKAGSVERWGKVQWRTAGSVRQLLTWPAKSSRQRETAHQQEPRVPAHFCQDLPGLEQASKALWAQILCGKEVFTWPLGFLTEQKQLEAWAWGLPNLGSDPSSNICVTLGKFFILSEFLFPLQNVVIKLSTLQGCCEDSSFSKSYSKFLAGSYSKSSLFIRKPAFSAYTQSF